MSLDKKIISGCRAGDRKAIRVFYETSAGWMLAIAMRYIPDRNEAMSLVNMSLIAALENLDSFDEKRSEKPEAWLKTILIRKTIDYLRKAKITNEKEIGDDHQAFVANLGESNTRRDELLQLVNKLSPATRAVFNLCAIEGYKHKEVSEMLDISEGTSKWHLNEARTKLKYWLSLLDKEKKVV